MKIKVKTYNGLFFQSNHYPVMALRTHIDGESNLQLKYLLHHDREYVKDKRELTKGIYPVHLSTIHVHSEN